MQAESFPARLEVLKTSLAEKQGQLDDASKVQADEEVHILGLCTQLDLALDRNDKQSTEIEDLDVHIDDLTAALREKELELDDGREDKEHFKAQVSSNHTQLRTHREDWRTGDEILDARIEDNQLFLIMDSARFVGSSKFGLSKEPRFR